MVMEAECRCIQCLGEAGNSNPDRHCCLLRKEEVPHICLSHICGFFSLTPLPATYWQLFLHIMNCHSAPHKVLAHVMRAAPVSLAA